MEIVKTKRENVPAIVGIYEAARRFMRRSGNPNQWGPSYPSADTLVADIERGGSYVCVDGGRIVATFFFVVGDEPTYAVIEEGAWLNAEPYGVIHRVASDGTVRGVMQRILDFCFGLSANIRIDTHRDNAVMRRSLARYGFAYCGVVHLTNGDERLAYQRTAVADASSV